MYLVGFSLERPVILFVVWGQSRHVKAKLLSVNGGKVLSLDIFVLW